MYLVIFKVVEANEVNGLKNRDLALLYFLPYQFLQLLQFIFQGHFLARIEISSNEESRPKNLSLMFENDAMQPYLQLHIS